MTLQCVTAYFRLAPVKLHGVEEPTANICAIIVAVDKMVTYMYRCPFIASYWQRWQLAVEHKIVHVEGLSCLSLYDHLSHTFVSIIKLSPHNCFFPFLSLLQ